MNLEQRVQTLENEVAVLKNQIQTTLLDIQAMLMTNAHPALRGEASVPSSTSWGDDTAPAAPSASVVPVRKFSLEQLEDASDEPEALPAVRQVLPAQLNTSPPTTNGAAMPRPTPQAPLRSAQAQPAPEPAARQMPKQNYGSGMDNTNGGQQWAAAPHQQPMQEPPQYAPFAQPNGATRRPNPAMDSQDNGRMEELRLWILDKIDDIGGQATLDELLAYSHSDYFTPEELKELINFAMEAAEEQLAQTRPPVPPAVNRARRPAVPSAKTPNKQRKATRAIVDPGEDTEEHRRTLLRLIAGIQNVGTTNKKSKRK